MVYPSHDVSSSLIDRGQIEDLEEQKLLDIFNSNVISGMMLLGKAKN